MKAFLAITLAASCLVAASLAQEQNEHLLAVAGQGVIPQVEYAQLQETDEEGSGVRNKRQYGGFGGRGGGFGGRGFGGGGYGGRGFGGGGYGGRGFGGGYGGRGGGFGGGGFGGGGYGR